MASEIFVVTDTRQLIAINPINLSVREIGQTSQMFTDVAFAPNGKLYGITFSGLYEIDATDASTTYIGSLGVSGANAFEIDGDGNAYLAANNNGYLYTVDLATGQATAEGAYSNNAESEGDLSFFGGNLYLTTTDHRILRIDPETGSVLSSVSVSVDDIYGLEQMGSTLYGFAGSTFYSVDPSSGRLTIMRDVAGYGGFNGAASFDFSDPDTGVRLTGTTQQDWLFGGAGNDRLSGLDGNDFLYGYGGQDRLAGGRGNDTLNGGAGADRMEGGTGNDIYAFDNTGDVVVEAANAGTDTVRSSITLTLGVNVEHLVLTGSASINGNGNSLDNNLTGNVGSNTLNGWTGSDRLIGAAGNDRLNGGTGFDRIEGGAGNDRLTGGAGADKLFGGAGADQFVFSVFSDSTTAFSGRDVIFDFSHAQGDRIALSGLDANAVRAGNQAFVFIGETTFTGTAGQLRSLNSRGDTFIYGDTDGDMTADFAIRIEGTIDFIKEDFSL